MKIYFAGDHAGFEFKKDLIAFVKSLGHEVEDMGPFTYDPQDDYPDFVIPLAKKVAASPDARGILTAASGQGEVVAANRIQGVRAVVYYGGTLDVVYKTREHNDANILSVGARFAGFQEAKEAVHIFLETKFSNEERHVRRLAKIDQASL